MVHIYDSLLVLLFFNMCISFLNTSTIQEGDERAIRIKKFCSAKYTPNCLLFDVCKLLDRLSVISHFQILPGVFVVTNRSEEIPIKTCENVLFSNQTEKLHVHVRQKWQEYLDSLSISWKIMDRNSVFSVRQLGDDLITELLPRSTTVGGGIEKGQFVYTYFDFLESYMMTPYQILTFQMENLSYIGICVEMMVISITSPKARGKKKNGKESVMWAAGAMAALGTSALFLITGKAAVASLIALLLSLLCYFKGTGHSSYTTATQAAYATPYKQQCAEALIDINGRGDQSSTLMGYKKRTAEDNSWNYQQQRYAQSTGDSA